MSDDPESALDELGSELKESANRELNGPRQPKTIDTTAEVIDVDGKEKDSGSRAE